MGREVRLLLVLLDRVAFRPAVALPIDVPNVVAGNVFAVLHELDREAAIGALVIADAQALDDGAGFDAERLGPGDHIGRKVIHRVHRLAGSRRRPGAPNDVVACGSPLNTGKCRYEIPMLSRLAFLQWVVFDITDGAEDI